MALKARQIGKFMTSSSTTNRLSYVLKRLKDPTYLLRRSLEAYRVSTSSLRLLPEFMIIGTQKGGTSSLYNYLIQHPCIASAFAKEVHFFDNHTRAHNFGKGIAWYRSHFAYDLDKSNNKRHKQQLITGEASPDYIFDPHAPQRIAATLPSVKLIALLRNPIDRAYSHYLHNTRASYDVGRETLSFEEAITKEEERLQGEREKLLQDESYFSYNYMHYSYLSRGIYVKQLKTWFDLFPREQILVLKSEDFYANPDTIFKQVLGFLKLPVWELQEYKSYNSSKGSQANIISATREYLAGYFKFHNERLYQQLDINFGWDQ